MKKLNLGAGKKPMPAEEGWINVDLYVDDPGYLKSDATKLPMIGDSSVDQIRLFHVIEHLGRTVVPSALKEWLRVLKPGGFIEIECPDVLKCCVNVLQAYTSGNMELIIRYGLQGLYGHSDGPHDGMQHLWLYYPEYLANLLTETGFSSVVEEDPISKPWQPTPTIRDMRLVAYK